MKKGENNVTYRASIGALIVDSNKRFLLTELNDARPKECDFVKGGRHKEETELETLEREIKEELGTDFKFEVLEKSNWNVIYEWSKEHQERMGFQGQARVSFWVLYKGGEIKLNTNELRAYYWVEEEDLLKYMRGSHFPEFYIKTLLLEWKMIKEKYPNLFEN